MFITASLFKYCTYKELSKDKTINIRIAMVIPIGIGSYEDRNNVIDSKFNGYVGDLYGILHDINHCLNLFGNNCLNYDIYSCICYNHIQNRNSHKKYWKKSEMINFLRYQADHLDSICNDGTIRYKS